MSQNKLVYVRNTCQLGTKKVKKLGNDDLVIDCLYLEKFLNRIFHKD